MVTWFPAGYFRRHVLPLLGIGLPLLALSIWLYADQASFARRAIVTTGTVQEVLRGAPIYRDDGQTSVRINGRVRYTANNVEIVSVVPLGSCGGGLAATCVSSKAGDTIKVAYDPTDVGRAKVVPWSGLPMWPVPHVLIWATALISLVCLVAAGINVGAVRPIRPLNARRHDGRSHHSDSPDDRKA
ncbi:hypothetical protein N5079_14990 [Planotetraspora sp. A-T 1434]|uniref:DUF3592 domain-containing protein n=1 Tax=Planotetraspora sp. A-T 1434 TaxID=2979219 RepID=UPI0021C1B6B7|nr:DUF3592 domain-containing protein [Planotetraspora sp. A-T 1434]MCT9931521.1 hypothetical protein [Planotetraspora sp. A-T 1434]